MCSSDLLGSTSMEFLLLLDGGPAGPGPGGPESLGGRSHRRSEERRVGKESRSRWSPYH